MRLKPRYSLLTLLILTALVAGGVKLWYGPHRVLERESEPGRILEREFTFTRNLRGERIIHGTCIERIYQPDESTLYVVHIKYYQHGALMPWLFVLSEQYAKESSLAALAKFGMTPDEQAACKADIDQEKHRLVALGLDYVGRMFVLETVEGRDWIWNFP